MIKNNNACNNCGKHGHSFHQCKLPITSYGIILFRPSERGLQFLMIRRKDSFGYIDFLRGKYSPYNVDQMMTFINEMSISEKKKLLEESFESLWHEMWGQPVNSQFKNEENMSSKKLEVIKNGVLIDNKKITLEDLINNSNTNRIETEWEFPKGRRNFQEKDLDCALREFEEETGYLKSNITVIENLLPFEEMYIGSNHKSYKHKYYIAYMNKTEDMLNGYQKTEVSKLEWKTIDECLNSIRQYNLEKKNLIININKVLQEYRLYT